MKQNTHVKLFLDGLKEKLSENDRLSLSYATGASVDQLARLKRRYPYCPESLIELLSEINGTYWEKYGEHTITVLMLGSDVFEYPYYLKSVEQILEENVYGDSINNIYGDHIDDFDELVDKGIDPNINTKFWLCFSDCMNNGGTSQLFIDFNPSEEGKPGQVIRFLHDPDSYKVIAEDFDKYLQMLINDNYSFITKYE